MLAETIIKQLVAIVGEPRLLLGDERRHNRASPVLLLLLLYTQSRDTRCAC